MTDYKQALENIILQLRLNRIDADEAYSKLTHLLETEKIAPAQFLIATAIDRHKNDPEYQFDAFIDDALEYLDRIKELEK